MMAAMTETTVLRNASRQDAKARKAAKKFGFCHRERDTRWWETSNPGLSALEHSFLCGSGALA